MSDFFRQMNFPRAVILVSLLASVVMGWFVYEKTARLEEVHGELERVPAVVREIQRLGIELQQYEDISGPGTEADFDYDPYIRSIAAAPRVGIGQVRIDPSQRDYSRDVEDRTYQIRLQNKTQKYHQSKIGNFLYKLESDNRRVKVTRLKLTPAETVRPGEIGRDSWTFEAAITERRQKPQG